MNRSEPHEWTVDDLAQEREDPLGLPLFEYSGNAILVPALQWTRDAEWQISRETRRYFYDRFYAPTMGAYDALPKEIQPQVLDFAFKQAVLGFHIMPPMKQAAIMFEDVFLVMEYYAGEPVATTPFDPANKDLRPRLGKGIGIPDVVYLPQHLFIGFLARLLGGYDYKDRRLRMPGWSSERNFNHLKNVNQTLNELAYIRWMFDESASFSVLLPKEFTRVVTRKANIRFEGFSGSPSVDILFPDLDAVPWDEVVDIGKSAECRELRKRLTEWDAELAGEGNLDWAIIGRRIQPIVDALINEMEKSRVSRTRAWVNFLASLLPAPAGAVPSAIDLVKAYSKRGVAPGVSKIKAQSRKR